jgi:hypothetical protein
LEIAEVNFDFHHHRLREQLASTPMDVRTVKATQIASFFGVIRTDANR